MGYSKVRDIEESWARSIDAAFGKEHKRRRYKVEDEYRQDFIDDDWDGFNYAKIPMNDKTWQQLYWETFGIYVPRESSVRWECTCGMKFYGGYPPYRCNLCKKLSPIGELDKVGAWKR